MNENAPELYRKYRPAKFSEVLGQDEAVKMLIAMGKENKIPHCILLSGPSGCGKTTIARILQAKLKCSDADFKELNIADVRGIEMVREIRSRMPLAPIGGQTRIWLLDEVARATTDAQNAFLKMLEDPPDHVYFILATTEPQKLLTTIKTRATEIKVKALDAKTMKQLISSVLDGEGVKISMEVVDKIVEVSSGSPRKALVFLGQVIKLTDVDDQIGVVEAGIESKAAIDIARGIMNNISWPEMSKLLKVCEDEPETVRRVILGYFSSVLLGGGKFASKSYDIITIFEKAWYDGGKASMVACVYEALK